MAFSEQEVRTILKANEQVPKWVTNAREQHKDLKALIDGDDFRDLLSKVEHIEKSEKKWKVRQKYSRSIKDTNERLLRPVDNVYSATGGSKNYALSESQRKKLLQSISKIRGGQSLERWLKDNWMHTYHTDPNGIVFIEYNESEAYPTYKSINRIRNYGKDGQSLVWLLFEAEKEIVNGQTKEYIRFVDDENDLTFERRGNDYVLIEEKSFKHPFGRVPGVVNSNIEKVGTDFALSPIDKIVETEKQYLRDQSNKTLYKFLLWNPIFWRYKQICPTCHGTLKTGDEKCKDCDNTGFKLDRDITDEVLIPLPDDNEQPIVTPDIAGWINPPAEIMEQFNLELENLEVKMYESHWGSHKSKLDSNVDKTATEVWLDAQPVMNRLNAYADVAEYVEKECTELLANWLFPTKDKNEPVSNINYGRNYIIQPPEFLLQEYHTSKENGDNTTILDRKYSEYLTSKYKNDPVTLRVQILKSQLEPYLHYDLEQITKVFGNDEAQKKMLFGDWWETLSFKDFDKTKEQLEKERDKYFDENLTEQTSSQEE